jgi:transketolase
MCREKIGFRCYSESMKQVLLEQFTSCYDKSSWFVALDGVTAEQAAWKPTGVVSMPCWEFFDAQSAKYKEEVLPSKVTARLAIEAGVSMGWSKYVGDKGDTLCVDCFGTSAPAGDVFRDYGFTVENVVKKARNLVK